MLSILQKIGRQQFWQAKDGVAAIEFAFAAPLLVTLLLGTVQLCNALECNEKVTSVASSVADLVAQTSNVSTSDITGIFSAGNYVLYPFPTASTKIVISSIVNSAASGGGGQNKVCWSQATSNATALAAGTVMTVPTGVIPSGGSAIFVQVNYTYSSAITNFLFNSLAMGGAYYARPRESSQVTLNTTTSC
jgi:Flp pilus assembly protein TadG